MFLISLVIFYYRIFISPFLLIVTVNYRQEIFCLLFYFIHKEVVRPPDINTGRHRKETKRRFGSLESNRFRVVKKKRREPVENRNEPLSTVIKRNDGQSVFTRVQPPDRGRVGPTPYVIEKVFVGSGPTCAFR